MKYVMLFCHGLADEPVADLGGRTPFELAKTPNLDRMAKEGCMGLASFVPNTIAVSPDAACFSILGYDPQEFYTGLAPLDALALGVPQSDSAVAFRADLVTVFDETLQDATAGHISSKEAQPLLARLSRLISTDRMKLSAGEGYKNILVVSDDALADDLDDLETTAPSRLVGQNFTKGLPKGRSESVISSLMKKSKEVLDDQEINRVRIDLKENPANMLWMWGQGRKPQLPPFRERHGLSGAAVSGEDFVKGLGIAVGFSHAENVRSALKKADFVFVYSAPAAPSTELKVRVKRIEDFDQEVGEALRALEGAGDVRVCAGTDSVFAATQDRPASHAQTPFVVWGAGVEPSGAAGFSEKTAALSRIVLGEARQLINRFIAKGKFAT